MIYYKSRITLAEAEDDDNTSSEPAPAADNTEDNTTDDQTQNTAADDDNDNTDNNETPDNNTGEDDNNLDMSTETEDNGDFSIDSEDDTPSEEDNGEGDTTTDDTDEPKEDESKGKYDSIYDELSDTEKINKDNKLKEDFKTLYEAICTLIKRCSLIPNTSDNLKVMKRIILNLNDLKQYIIYYINKSYSSKSYIENSIEFYKYLAIYNGINTIFTNIEKMNKNDEK